MRGAFARLTQPSILVWGKQDLMTPVENAVSLLRLNPQARIEVFDYCRMMPEQEHPERFNELVHEALSVRAAPA